jgi:UDP-4-amino-4,6-dideoxy-N-acetyl-beta-L-altrosamine transaminase
MAFLPYGHQWIDEEDIRAVVEVLRGDWLTQGPAVERFEGAMAERLGVRHAVAFANGTAALHGAYHVAGVGPGDEVLTSPMTFAATANGALYAGGTPVFADIDPSTLCLSPARAEERLTARTRVIAPVSFAGYPAPIAEFRRLADRVGALVVEDACHALGGEREGVPVGREADLTAFSFHPVKHITTGEGGLVTTQDDGLASRLRLFRAHGITKDPGGMTREPDGPWYTEMIDLGYNYRLSDLQCALGASQLRRLDGFLARRRELARRYDERFARVEGVRIPPAHPGHAYHLYVIQVEPSLRRPLFERLRERGLGVMVHYPLVPLHPYYRRRFGYAPGDFPEAEAYYAGAISLPLFPQMDEGDLDRVVREVQEGLSDLRPRA